VGKAIMEATYSNDENIQILIGLLKANGIKRIIASPGVKNIAFVGSVQKDNYFDVYSAADERSAAYMACGMASESGETVVITCTEATASRNYMPGLTEAYYRKLPILVVTCTWDNEVPGNLVPQSTDRTARPNDIVRCSVTIPVIKENGDKWICEYKMNCAIIALRRGGCGPSHINIMLRKKRIFDVKVLPSVNPIKLVSNFSEFDENSLNEKKIAIFVGSHRKWTKEETQFVEKFCETFNAVVIHDHTSNYKGKYGIQFSIIYGQININLQVFSVDILIHMGGVSGAYLDIPCKEVWRIDEDGEIRDTYKKLSTVFFMKEVDFFSHFTNDNGYKKRENDILEKYEKYVKKIYASDIEIPFSNIWMARQLSSSLPENSEIHLGILNSLRSWNFWEIPRSVDCYSNVGGFGIDGILSSLIGSSLIHKDKLYFAVLGDLAFFYDMNALGNRHIGNNIRILLVNNGCGTEFRNYNNPGAAFGEDANYYIAAAGHYGNRSQVLVKHYAEDLGFEYMCAHSKQEFISVKDAFLSPEKQERSIILEAFTRSEDESNALKNYYQMYVDDSFGGTVKSGVKKVIGNKATDYISKLIK